jgi:hypothetical protein
MQTIPFLAIYRSTVRAERTESRDLARTAFGRAPAQKQEMLMDLQRIQSGRLRAVGYDSKTRTLRVELDDGSLIDYANVGEEIWRRLSNSSSAWSYYRDNVEEEFAGKRVTAQSKPKRNPLDDLF